VPSPQSVLLFPVLIHAQNIVLGFQGACEDSTHIAHETADMNFCLTQTRDGIVDAGAVALFYALNTGVAFLGRISLRVHITTMVVQIALLVTSSAINTKRGPFYESQLVAMTTHCLSFFFVVIALDRKWRMHFTENHLKLRLVEQERALVSLLWCVCCPASCRPCVRTRA
jgi:hypothetical protein